MNEVTALETSKDVFTVYMDIIGGVSKPIAVQEGVEPPDWAFPNTFIGREQLFAAFPGKEIKILSTASTSSEKVANGPSQAEIDVYLKTLGHPTPKESPELKQYIPNKNSTTPTPDVILLTFKQYVKNYKQAPSKKKDTAKAYCNGMAKVIKMVYPGTEEELKAIVEGKDEEDDLL